MDQDKEMGPDIKALKIMQLQQIWAAIPKKVSWGHECSGANGLGGAKPSRLSNFASRHHLNGVNGGGL